MEKGYRIGDGVRRAGLVCPYVRLPFDPVTRPLQIYSTDPADSKLIGSIATVKVPYEPLNPGPVGRLFEVVGTQGTDGLPYLPVDLEDPTVLVRGGIAPSPTNYHFIMQMTYAVAMSTYEAFRVALGRNLHWGFDSPFSEPARLKIYPFFEKHRNAFYDRDDASVKFGWYLSDGEVEFKNLNGDIKKRNLRKGKVFTALSHDIVVHEVSHALLDGLRPNFLRPFHSDTLALHEGFADLVAVFQHFGHRDLVKAAILESGENLTTSRLLTDIARQFGQTQEYPSLALRTAVDAMKCDASGCRVEGEPILYDTGYPIHKLGSVLVSSVFQAFATVFQRKTRNYINIATRGTGVLPKGNLESTLADLLAKKASELAGQFLSICIRAIDYCPPVAVTFGDYLRAMITADQDLVPDDPYGYRESLINAFIDRDIPIDGVDTLSESSLLWETKYEQVDKSLLNAILREQEMGSMIQDTEEKYRKRASRVGDYLVASGAYKRLGLIDPASPPQGWESVSVPVIESARISRRIGPDSRLETDLVVEITQQVDIRLDGRRFPAIQGCTVIIDSRGKIRYVIGKDAITYVKQMQERITDRTFAFGNFWSPEGTRWVEQEKLLARIHAECEI